jgi:hypothetical protein
MLIARLSILWVHTAISADHTSEYFTGAHRNFCWSHVWVFYRCTPQFLLITRLSILWVHTAVYADHTSEYFTGAHRNFCWSHVWVFYGFMGAHRSLCWSQVWVFYRCTPQFLLITRLSILLVHTAISADHTSEDFMGAQRSLCWSHVWQYLWVHISKPTVHFHQSTYVIYRSGILQYNTSCT